MRRIVLLLACLAIGAAIIAFFWRPDRDSPVQAAIEQYIQPNFESFAETSTSLASSVSDLCERPGSETLQKARSEFSGAAVAWARIEFMRAGPLSADHRAERILFWPDRKGIALRQVQAALANQDQSVLTRAGLTKKSVALQGFGALEFLLYGTGAQELASPAADFRCGFAKAVAENVRFVAQQSLADWKDAAGFSANWLSPSASNRLYRNEKEALAELVRSLAYGFQMVWEQRLLPIAPNGVRPPSHKRGLFWRSNGTFGMIHANLEAMQKLLIDAGLTDLLPEDQRELANLIALNFFNAQKALKKITLPVEQAVYDDAHAAQLSYLLEVTRSLQRMVGEEYVRAVELPPGFSPLDGD